MINEDLTRLSSDTFVPSVFKVSPLVRIALWSLYLALLLPLPFLMGLGEANKTLTIALLCLGIGIGGVLLHMALSETVHLDDVGLAVRYPGWVLPFLRRDWSLAWSEVADFKARSTGQGGLVYYLVAQNRSGFLLPTRVVRFSRMVRLIQLKTGIDTRDVKPLAQPWMYATLLGAAGLLAIADLWVVWFALTQSGQA